MSTRPTTDQRIAAWAADAAGSGTADYLSEVMDVVNRTSQKRWARWVPAAWTVSPSRAPLVRPGLILVTVLALLLLLAAGTLLAGAFRRPAFTLQSVTPLPGAAGAIFTSPSDSAMWGTVSGGVVRVDPATGQATVIRIPGTASNLTGVVEHDSVLWLADYNSSRVVRVDPATGAITAEVPAAKPFTVGREHGTWVVADGTDEVIRIDADGAADMRFEHVIGGAALVPGALWYVEGPIDDAHAVEVDPATGVIRQRIAVPAEAAAGGVTIDANGNPWLASRRRDSSTILALDAKAGTAGTPFEVPYDVIGGLVSAAGSMWALPAPGQVDGPRLIELSPAGPTGRVQEVDKAIDPDGAVVAFGSLWITSEPDGSMYRYSLDGLGQ